MSRTRFWELEPYFDIDGGRALYLAGVEYIVYLEKGGPVEVVTEKKRLIIGKYMAGDIESLAYLLKSVSSRDRHAADVTLYGLKRALVEVLTSFPVYRSYVSPDAFSELDRRHLRAAIERAKEANLGLLLELKFIERFLLLDFADHLTEDERKRWTHFVMRFQ